MRNIEVKNEEEKELEEKELEEEEVKEVEDRLRIYFEACSVSKMHRSELTKNLH